MKKLIFNFKFSIFKKQKGFTLIELLIFMGIFSILLVVLFQMLIAVFDVQLESQSTSVVSQDGRYIINKLSYDIKNSSAISSPAIGGRSSTLQIVNNGNIYTYNLSSGNLNLTNVTLGSLDQLNSTNSSVSNLSFLRLADSSNKNDTITVSFTLTSEAQKRSGKSSEDFNITIGRRE